jgi:H+-translocating NAD(P) transhydrogenase
MTRGVGVLRLCTTRGGLNLTIPQPIHPLRLFSNSVKLLQTNGKPVEAVKGVAYKNLTIGVPKEKWANEKRVAVTPVVAAAFVKKGFTVNVEKGAGVEAKFRDSDYEAAGAHIVDAQKAFQAGEKFVSSK